MPYHSSSDDEESNTAPPVGSRGGRRPLRGTRRRRGNTSEDSDSNDNNDDDANVQTRDLASLKASQSPPAKTVVENNAQEQHGNHTSPGSQEVEGHPSPHSQEDRNLILEDPDPNTMRIMVSTDNHVGFAETDNVRGNDSFAALEEVLYLAKEYSCDMVMLAGDLFHENRPSRRTLYKTMDILRRYCMGPNAIQIQVVTGSTSQSNNANNTAKDGKRSPFVRGYVNYEDANYSVDLPIFSIHGNHDDPSRDGGNSELYAALDLLDVANLLNYFGKQEDTTNIRVDPILLRKGTTQVALYGLGSMRDERLNRMWRGGHLTFSRPAETAAANNDENAENPSWFNIFALHQNRDRGRGAKNCIKEDMIPEWIDFVCWGHEHECDIELTESVVGTFRISQPGSSVATSLVEGESVRKKIAVLDVREGQFRLTPIPLTQVRSFVVSTVKLAEEPGLDPDDPKVDAKVSKLLEEKVRVLIHDAREQRQELLREAKAGGNGLARFCEGNVANSAISEMPLKHTLHKEEEVLVRLKVDHTGFAVVNNQRFGAKFVGNVANPTDILVFNRKKAESGGSRAKSVKDIAPIEPTEIEEMNIEELIVEQFESNTAKLELFDDKKISSALDSYVGKQEARAINETLEKLLGKQQKRLIKNGVGSASEGLAMNQDDGENDADKGNKRKVKSNGGLEKSHNLDDNSYEDEDVSMEDSPVAKVRSKKKTSQRTTTSRKQTTSQRKASSHDNSASDDDDIQMVDPPPRNRSKTSSTRKRATKKTLDYSIDSDESFEEDDNVIRDDLSPPNKKRVRGKAQEASSNKTRNGRRGRDSTESNSGLSQSQLSFQPVKRKTTREQPKRKSRARGAIYNQSDSESGDSFTLKGRSYNDDNDDWGTAKSGSTF